jgi:tetratricopeptide (TPR) repeat protein
VPFFFAGLLALASVWLTRPLWYDPDARRVARELATARHLLEDPHASVSGLPVLLSDALSRMDRFPARLGEAHFLLGSTYLRLAEPLAADRAAELRRQARCHLQKAESLGVPEGDRARLRYRLGKVWYQTGGEWPKIIAYLADSIEPGADDRREGYSMLTQAYLHLPTPDINAALQANEKQLQLPISDENLQAPARLLRGELLMKIQEREAARKVLARIGSRAPAPIVSRARYLRASSYQEEQAWANAAPLWEAILADTRETPRDPGRILYDLGLCHRNLNHLTEAARAWERSIQQGGDTAQAVTFRLALLRLEMGNIAAVVELYERVLQNVAKPENYQVPCLPLTEARALVESGCRLCRDAGKFEEAQKLALLHARLAPPGPSQLLLAQVAQAWALSNRDQAQKAPNTERARRLEETARSHFKEAGAAYETAFAPDARAAEKAERLWQAAEAYRQGQDNPHVVSVLERFVQLLPASERWSEAWYRLGESHLALRHEREARAAFTRCLEQVGPFAFRARYQLSLAELRAKNPSTAEEMLLQNLDLMRRGEVDPQAHQQTLYTLADLLYERGDYNQAAARWESALTDYPTNPEVLSARYRLGECYRRQAARVASSVEKDNPLVADLQIRYQRRAVYWLEKAVGNFQKLANDLDARPANSLTPAEAVYLRKALFAQADCHFELHHFSEAARLYHSLARRYPRQYEELVALEQLWYCYTLLGETDRSRLKEADATLQRARIALDALDESVFLGRPETEQRAAWEQKIKEAQEQLRKLAP